MDEEITRDRLDDHGDCLAEAELIAFNCGKLPGDRMEHVGRHLTQCARCQAALQSLTDESDPLLGSLRSSHTEVAFIEEPGCVRLQARARALAGAELPPGRRERIGPYRLLRRLKGGGMGDVYEALHTHLDRRVALKTLRGDRMHNPEFVERFYREMKAVGRLDHPNIVRASDAGAADGCHYLVMDFVDGFDLAAVVRQRGTLAVADAAEVVRQAAIGLQCIHEHSLVHRDIKPSNLMLGSRGTIKILDLGLALLHEGQAAGDELTDTGLGLGTADYMAPEQAQDAHRATIQSDLYSLGCTLYKLLAGRAPFDMPRYSSTLKKMQAHLRDPVAAIQTVRADVPDALAAVVHRLLDKEPSHRFASPQQVADALTPFAVGSDLPRLLQEVREHDTSRPTAPRPSNSAPPIPRPARPPRLRSIQAISAAGLVLVMCGIVVATLYRPGTPPIKEQPAPPGNAQAIEWPADFPQTLRERPLGARIELLRPAEWKDGPRDPAQGVANYDKKPKGVAALPYQPLWFRRLAGTGVFFAMPLALALNSNEISMEQPGFVAEYTALALDDDRALRWFEFEAELWPGQNGAIGGVFFGWRLSEEQRGAYFVQLAAPLVPPNQPVARQLTVAYVTLPAVSGGVAVSDTAFDRMAADAVAVIPLTKALNRYPVRVRCEPGMVSVTVADEPPARFAPRFEPRGSLGIWARRGSAWFGRAASNNGRMYD
jgi:serine/threonine protein kinase